MSKKITEINLNKSKLIKLLAKLELKTIQSFKAWYKQIGHPNRDAFLVLKYVLSYYPHFDSPKLQQEYAFRKIFKTKDYKYRRLMKTVSQVHIDLKQYLIQQTLEKDTFLKDYLLAKIYTKYNLLHERQLLIDKKIDVAKATVKAVAQPNDFFETLQWHELAFFSEDKTTNKDQKTGIEAAMHALDWYYLGKKLKYACEMATQQKLYNQQYDIQLLQPILTLCENSQAALPLYHQVYFTAWKLITAPTDAIFKQLQTLFINHYQALKQEDQLIILTHLINYTIAQIRANATNAPQLAFDLYDFGLQQKIFTIDVSFVDVHFSNIISIATSTGKLVWVEQLLAGSIGKLVQNRLPSNYSLALARINFAKKAYDQCIAHLIEVDYSVFSFSFRARIYQIACFYDLNEAPDVIETQCKSFESYLRRYAKKYPTTVKSCLNFIYFVRKLNAINPDKMRLQEMLNTIKTISFQTWLSQKIEALN